MLITCGLFCLGLGLVDRMCWAGWLVVHIIVSYSMYILDIRRQINVTPTYAHMTKPTPTEQTGTYLGHRLAPGEEVGVVRKRTRKDDGAVAGGVRPGGQGLVQAEDVYLF